LDECQQILFLTKIGFPKLIFVKIVFDVFILKQLMLVVFKDTSNYKMKQKLILAVYALTQTTAVG